VRVVQSRSSCILGTYFRCSFTNVCQVAAKGSVLPPVAREVRTQKCRPPHEGYPDQHPHRQVTRISLHPGNRPRIPCPLKITDGNQVAGKGSGGWKRCICIRNNPRKLYNNGNLFGMSNDLNLDSSSRLPVDRLPGRQHRVTSGRGTQWSGKISSPALKS
jgi:hypothetical protein